MPRMHKDKGIALKVAMIQRGKTQDDMAKILGIAKSTYNMKLLGTRKFSVEEKELLCSALGMSARKLFTKYKIQEDENAVKKSED